MRRINFLSIIIISIAYNFSLRKASSSELDQNYSNNDTNSTKLAASSSTCNIFQGKWVYDSSYPLYDFSTCPFIDDEFNCLKYKRPDRTYLKYRWQPFSCNLPSFNGLNFLEKFRGKKIMFVGDSLSLNIWQSLSCMIHASVPNAKTSLVRGGGLGELTFLDYDLKLLLYRTPFLVDVDEEKVGRVQKWRFVERNGHVDIQFMALVDSHWEFSTMGLHGRGRKIIQGHEPLDSILQRNDDLGTMGKSKCRSFEN